MSSTSNSFSSTRAVHTISISSDNTISISSDTSLSTHGQTSVESVPSYERIPPQPCEVLEKTKITIPFHLLSPLKAKQPQIDNDEIFVTRNLFINQPSVEVNTGNVLDKLHISDTVGYFEEDFTPGTTLVLLSREEVKDIMLNPQRAHHEVCNLVLIKKDGSLLPGFLPDFGDFALFPKSLKVVLKWMFEASLDTPPTLKKLWQSVAPRLPTSRHETVVHYGLKRLSCYSFPSRLYLFNIPLPSRKKIALEVDCAAVSSSPMDGRKYVFELSVLPKVNLETRTEVCEGGRYEVIDRKDVNIMVWNCMGVGRPSFLGNMKHLLDAHKPDIVVLLETRISRHLLHTLLRDTWMWKVVGVSPPSVYGGVAVLSTRNKVQFVTHMRLSNKILGCLKGEKMLFDHDI